MQYSKVSLKCSPLEIKQWKEAFVHDVLRKSVLKNFANFAGKHLCWSLFLIKLPAYSKQKQSFAHVFKNFVNFTGKHLCWSLFLIKFLTNFIKTLSIRCFPVKCRKTSRTPFLQNTSSGCFCQKRLQHNVCRWNLRNF